MRVNKIRVSKMILKSIIFSFFALLSVSAAEKPNILFIFADDLSFETLSYLGKTEAKTPNLDKLVSQGAHFTNSYNMGAWGGAVCAASRAMLNCGTYVNRAQKAINEKPRWSELMKGAGYKTYMTGKWHLGFGGEKTSALPFNRGFDKTFILDATGGDNFSNHSYLPYYKEAPWFKNGEPTELPENFYSSEFIIDEMINSDLESAKKEAFIKKYECSKNELNK